MHSDSPFSLNYKDAIHLKEKLNTLNTLTFRLIIYPSSCEFLDQFTHEGEGN